MICREELREYLNPVYDLERLISRVVYQTANPRDLIALKTSLKMLPPIRAMMEDFSSELLIRMREELDPLEDIWQLIEASIEEDPPISVREGGMIRSGFDEQVDRLRSARTEGKSWLPGSRKKNGRRPGSKTCASNLIKCSAIIWR